MIVKVENKSPKTTFLTNKGNRTPKEIWLNTENGVKGITKKDVISHTNRLKRLGITNDMTDKEAREQAKKYLESQNAI